MSDWQKTTCAFCATNCGLEVRTEGHRITKARPDKDSPRSQGYACRKGLAIAHFQDHPDRLTHPLKRVGDGFERISWDVLASKGGTSFEVGWAWEGAPLCRSTIRRTGAPSKPATRPS